MSPRRPTTASPTPFTVHREVFASGLRGLVVPMPGTRTVTFFLVVRTGSRNETSETTGVSHFLEHLFFKGSKKRPSARAISQAIDGVGGEINAFTSKEWTAFYAKAASRHVNLIVDVISDMVLRPLLDEDEINRERGVVIEETNMYEDTPMRAVGDFFEEVLFGKHALAHRILGTKENIARVPRETIVRYFQRQYRARSVVACLAGDIDRSQGMKLLRAALRRFPHGRAASPTPFHRAFGRARVRVREKNTDQTHVVIGAPAVAFQDPDRPAVDLAAAILGGGMSSRLFLEVRERRGLAYAVRTSADHLTDTGYLATQSGVDTKKALDACRVIVAEHARLADQAVSTAELKKSREFVKGKLLLGLESSDDVAQFVTLQEVLVGRILTPDDIVRLLDAVQPVDIQRVARRYLHPRHLRAVAIGGGIQEHQLASVL